LLTEHYRTAIHWHGIRQLNTNPNDGQSSVHFPVHISLTNVIHPGVPGVTQCPIAPGETLTYQFRATQYGSSWYHSHFSLQLGDGLFGPIVINGPATSNYDVDVGPILVQDWAHESALTIWETSQRVLALSQPVAANGLINGLNPFDCTGSTDPACIGTTDRFETSFTTGQKYLFRVVGTQVDGYIKFAIDGHTLTVIASDFVPIEPYETDSVILASGQRYDVVVEANQAVGAYWLRAIYQTACNNNDNDNKDNILGIIRYDGTDTIADPTTTVNPNITNSCGDEPYASLVPWLSQTVGDSTVEDSFAVQWYYELDLVYHWTLHTKNLMVNWSDPTLLDINKGVTTFPSESNVVTVSSTGQWVYWILQDLTLVDAFHPMHLHGHDFYVLAQGEGLYVPGLVKLNTENPPRRDTITLEGNGYIAIAFKTDNPGSVSAVVCQVRLSASLVEKMLTFTLSRSWLFHCHIAWHASQGLAMQLVESADAIPALMEADLAQMTDTCSAWIPFYNSPAQAASLQDDSGI
jgi:FtsP/CotA-like multicopper oxidase with cupredoxin domain